MVLPFYEYFNPKLLTFGITVDWRVAGATKQVRNLSL